ncbi:DUF1003 domain-containing protein [Lacisediminihabitans changchengi]|uniref:DUF1003 domain-containing protein n=1 Tax=Lacisediminihabitans changchengi TaxID=2787634 RepID=A0A934W3I2_9MICO|nr:DUF1003 domain-containing protein [Lacisediminihabitans changchengi]MBK4346530.1 DUF1003 domain-containing protein [Lacisediminihabitans changchengi]
MKIYGRDAPASRRQRAADAITKFSGSMTFVLLHVVWFAIWIAANVFVPHSFDPFPFGLLTLIVSLEAIFLSTFVLITQNRQSGRSDERAEQDFETNLYSQALSELIGERLGVSDRDVHLRFENLKSQAKKEDDADPKT